MSRAAEPADTAAAPGHAEPADDAATIAAMRSELARLREGVARLERGLGDLERRAAGSPVRARAGRYFEVLLTVYEHGRHGMDPDAFGALGAAHGYDRRGLGGFFTGRLAALRRQDGRIRLTAEGKRLLDHHLDSLP